MFEKALQIEKHEASYQQLGKVLVMQEDISAALATYHHALTHTPESADTLCQIGLLHLRQGASTTAKREG
jgi:Bardet-Biedl syndrome 4 protein